jgi:hypothetical protein
LKTGRITQDVSPITGASKRMLNRQIKQIVVGLVP